MRRILIATLGLACCKGTEGPTVANLVSVFTISLSPSSVVVPQGRAVPVTVNLDRKAGFADPLTVTASGLPDGVSASPLTITGNTGTLNLFASAAAAVGSADVTILGTSGAILSSAALSLSVSSPEFSLTVTPASISIGKGATGVATVTVSRQSFDGVITVTVSGLPGGVTADPLSIDRNRGNLILRVAADAELGSFPLTVSGASGSTRNAAPLMLFVVPRSFVDVSFGAAGPTPGFVTTTLDSNDGGTSSTATAVAVQPDGKIIAAGTRTLINRDPGCEFPPPGNCNGLAIARYNSDGTLDVTFIGDGGVGNPPPAGATVVLEDRGFTPSIVPNGVAVTDGGILIAASGPFASRETLLRFTSVGVLDPTFNPDGGRPGRAPQTINARAVTVSAGERILVAGQIPINGPFAVARYNSDGTLDDTFGDRGVLSNPFVGATNPTANGAIFTSETAKVVGQAVASGRNVVAVMSFNVTGAGSVDQSFNGTGQALIQLGSNASTGQAAVNLGANMVVIARTTDPDSHADIALASYQPDGGLDRSFGVDGVARTLFDPDAGSASVSAAYVSGGKIAVAGTFGRQFLVLRYNSDGSLDTTFGGSGVLIDVPPTGLGANVFNAVVVQDDGKIVATGNRQPPPVPSRQRFGLVRYLP